MHGMKFLYMVEIRRKNRGQEIDLQFDVQAQGGEPVSIRRPSFEIIFGGFGAKGQSLFRDRLS
jgi:hypothetical protein